VGADIAGAYELNDGNAIRYLHCTVKYQQQSLAARPEAEIQGPPANSMARIRITIEIDEPLLRELDRLTKHRRLKSRSQAISESIRLTIKQATTTRLARESAKLEAIEEQRVAEEGMSQDMQSWPTY
jgi:Arc/MetJ-type ribon-helix-helix transcriptional regulator